MGRGEIRLKFFCGCCGKIFRQMDLLSEHVNLEGFHLRTSQIPGYSVSSFDLERYFAETSEGEGMANTVKTKMTEMTRIFPLRRLRRFPKHTTKRGVVHL